MKISLSHRRNIVTRRFEIKNRNTLAKLDSVFFFLILRSLISHNSLNNAAKTPILIFFFFLQNVIY